MGKNEKNLKLEKKIEKKIWVSEKKNSTPIPKTKIVPSVPDNETGFRSHTTRYEKITSPCFHVELVSYVCKCWELDTIYDWTSRCDHLPMYFQFEVKTETS